MKFVLALALALSLGGGQKHKSPTNYQAVFYYDCANYVPPKWFELGIYSNGVYTALNKNGVGAGNCNGNQQFTIKGTSSLVTPATTFYVRGVRADGGTGPPAFFPANP